MSTRRPILSCVLCKNTYPLEDDRVACDTAGCGGLLDVSHDLSAAKELGGDIYRMMFAARKSDPRNDADRSGVWRFRELVLPSLAVEQLVTQGEGNTPLRKFARTNAWMGGDNVLFKHEGFNPTGSFKDRGLTVAMSWAKSRGAKVVACASTGNTSAAVASYASVAGIPSVILISEKGTALGKISQSLAYGALTLKIRGDFDAAMKLVLAAREKLGLTIMNSVNPFRLEGQKTIIWEALEQLAWKAPDWIVVPGGNLGNTSAFGKALHEALEIGMIDRMPRIAVIQAAGAAPFYENFVNGWETKRVVHADTIATAIKIGDPVNYDKAVRSVRWTNGVVATVTDQEIMDAKAMVDSDGMGAEPASCATAAGIRKLLESGMIKKSDSVVGILTGHFLKDPDATIGYHAKTLPGHSSAHANEPVVIDPTIEALEKALAERR